MFALDDLVLLVKFLPYELLVLDSTPAPTNVNSIKINMFTYVMCKPTEKSKIMKKYNPICDKVV